MELDTGLTFVERAAVSGDEEARLRNHKNARKAYDTALQFIPRATLTPTEKRCIEEKLAALKARLEAAGEELE